MANQITTLGNKEEALSEQYDAANVNLSKDRKAIEAAAKAVSAANASEAKAKSVLTSDAINAYMHNGTVGATALGDNTLKNANSGLLRAEYVSSLAANETDAKDAYRLAAVRDQAAQKRLQMTQAATKAQVATLSAARRQVIASQARLQDVYKHETTQIATLVAQIQAQQLAAAQAAADARTAAEQQAQLAAARATAGPTATSDASPADAGNAGATTTAGTPSSAAGATTTAGTPTSADATTAAGTTTATAGATTTAGTPSTDPPTTAAPTTTAPPATAATSSLPASSVGAGAVAAAETQVGVPYEWGGDTPGVGFDCSGLVMWAYAQVGVSLPHYSGGQFDAGVPVSMSDLEPGDLVFFANPDDHVAMYVGGGDIIEAPTYGESVHIVPMYSEFVQAVRIS